MHLFFFHSRLSKGFLRQVTKAPATTMLSCPRHPFKKETPHPRSGRLCRNAITREMEARGRGWVWNGYIRLPHSDLFFFLLSFSFFFDNISKSFLGGKCQEMLLISATLLMNEVCGWSLSRKPANVFHSAYLYVYRFTHTTVHT